MIIKIALSLFLLLLFTIVLIQRITSRVFQIIIITFTIIGCYFIWLPEHSSVVAKFLGVGRGADLILYFFIIMSFACFLILYLRLQQTMQTITKLARSVALSRPIFPDGFHGENKKSDH